MSRSADTLQFRFLPSFGEAIFRKINALREEHLFCDVTLVLGSLQGAGVPPLRFPGHKVVLAASSDFLRDQFLLHEGLAELRVGVVASVEVGKKLLVSCYTRRLEVQYITLSSKSIAQIKHRSITFQTSDDLIECFPCVPVGFLKIL